jgi:hypothetical protein
MTRKLEAARVALLFALGLAVGLHYARMGFMPLDQSICFDGGWRWLQGELPFRDYTAPNGFPVHALQALFFGVFGVNWFAYCLHAAIVNGGAVVLVDRMLVRAGLARWASSVFALCTASVFYPPFGVPYMDEHAFFFAALGVYLAWIGVQSPSERARRWSMLAVMPVLAVAFLCKQIPSVFALPAVVAIALAAKGERFVSLQRLVASTVVTAGAVFFAGALAGVDFTLARVYWGDLPAEEGARRLGYVPGVRSVLARFEETRAQLDLWSITAVHAVGLLGSALALLFAAKLWRRSEWRWSAALACALAAEFTLLACLGYVALTSNDKEIGAPLVFAAAGLAAAAIVHAGRALGPKAARVATGLAGLLALIVVRDADTFGKRVNATRKVNDMTFDEALANASAAELPEGLAFLRWSVPKLVKYSPADISELLQYLRERDGAFFLVGDASPLYGLADKPSVLPALWFHPGLTFPVPHDPRFVEFEDRLLERFERFGVRTIVIEPRVWVGYRAPEGETPPAKLITLEAFPRVKTMVDARRAAERDFGAFHVVELSP